MGGSTRGIKTAETLMTIYSACELRGASPYTFMIDYLNGGVGSMPISEQKQQTGRPMAVVAQ